MIVIGLRGKPFAFVNYATCFWV